MQKEIKKNKKNIRETKKKTFPEFFTATIYLFTGVIFEIFHACKLRFQVHDFPKNSAVEHDFHAHF